MQSLTLIILACTVNVSDQGVGKFTTQCREYEEILNDEIQISGTPYGCMMRSPIYLAQFMEKHPGMSPRRWTCKFQYPSKKI